MKTRKVRMIAIIMTLLILASALPVAVAAGSFEAVVKSSAMKVYQRSAPYGYMGTLTKGTTVTVEAYSHGAALIRYNGKSGLAKVSDLTTVTGATKAVSASAKSQQDAVYATASEQASAKTMVTNCATRVYKRANASSSYVSVKAGTKLGLIAVSGNVAKVVSGGKIGYVPARHLSTPGVSTVSSGSASNVQKYSRIPVVTTRSTRIYARPSTSSSYITIGRGVALTLLAAKGNCAMVERNGKVGYVAKNLLTTNTGSSPAKESSVKTEEVRTDDTEEFSGSNEEAVFKFLTKVVGFNTAAACGVMANIKYESGYKATSGGDGGSSIGIVQWHGSRKTRLIKWCKDNDYDYTGLKGQLYFLQYEMKRYYPAVYNRLKAVANSSQGAYDAGYDFCYNFEAPSSRATRSVTRGNYARTTLWQRYKD